MDIKNITFCPICSSSTFERLAVNQKDDIKYSYMRCLKCDLRFVNPMPLLNKEEKSAINKEAPAVKFDDLQIPVSLYLNSEAIWNKPVDNARVKDLMNYVKKGNLLDIGCNRGSLLVSAKSKGFNAIGVEIVPELTQYIQNKYKIKIFPELKTADFCSEYFDVVNMSHILEHLDDPAGDLIEVNRILKHGGILAISIPNPCGFVFHLHNVFHFLTMRYKRSRYSTDLYPPIHL